LGTLDVGQAIVKLQGRNAKPFQITIPEFIIEKGKITDANVRQRMRKLAPTFEEADFRVPLDSTIDIPEKAKFLEDNEIAFLKDILEHPDSGVAARYKRVGLSVRQGQKLIEKLFEEGLIEQRLETTKSRSWLRRGGLDCVMT
jgi:hypothetical protein